MLSFLLDFSIGLGWMVFVSLLVLLSLVWKICTARRRPKSVVGDVVLITGGAMGLGKLMAQRFVALGANVVLWDIQEDVLDNTVAELKTLAAPHTKVFGYVCDITNKERVYKLAQLVKKEVGVVDILVNNAGVVFGKSILESKDDEVERTVAVNYISNFYTVKAFLPDMIEQKCGHIITISSVAGFTGVPFLADYCSSKAASFCFGEALRSELKTLTAGHVKTTLVCPYYILTGMFEGTEIKSTLGKLIAGNPLEPDTVAGDIVQAILLEEEFVVLPSQFLVIGILRALLPTRALDWFQGMTGATQAMNNFKGRGARFGMGKKQKKQ